MICVGPFHPTEPLRALRLLVSQGGVKDEAQAHRDLYTNLMYLTYGLGRHLVPAQYVDHADIRNWATSAAVDPAVKELRPWMLGLVPNRHGRLVFYAVGAGIEAFGQKLDLQKNARDHVSLAGASTWAQLGVSQGEHCVPECCCVELGCRCWVDAVGSVLL